jgi:hypothetical protein
LTKKKKPEDLLKVGRPSEYRPEYCEDILEYFNKALYKSQDSKSWGKESKELNDFPTFQYWTAVKIGITIQTMHNWAKAHPEFMEALERCKKIQENMLLNGALSRAYDSSFAKFIMNSISDTFKERPIEVDLGDKTKKMLTLAYALPNKPETEE